MAALLTAPRLSTVAAPAPRPGKPSKPRPKRAAQARKMPWNKTAREKADDIVSAKADALEALQEARRAVGQYWHHLGYAHPILALAGVKKEEAIRLREETGGGRWLIEKLITILGGKIRRPTPKELASAEAEMLALMEADGFDRATMTWPEKANRPAA